MWSKSQLEAALEQIVPDDKFNKITIDSRKIHSGDIFIGIKGQNFNGSDFAADAIKSGANLALVDHIPNEMTPDQLVVVEDTYRDGLMKLANYRRENSNATFIGVTGSVGKTTTKDMLRLVFGDTYATQGNLNNNYGLPLSLANMDDSKFGIFELGMSAPGEISFLSTTLRPHIAIITGIAPAHLANFSSLDGIAAAKAEIVDGLLPNGFLVVNFDSPSLDIILKVAGDRKIVGYSMMNNQQSQVCLIQSEIVIINGVLFTKVYAKYTTLGGSQSEIQYKINGVGDDLVCNSLGVLATLIACNLDANMMNRLKEFETVSGRGKIHHIESLEVQLMDESYNSNPTSLRSALKRVNVYSKFVKCNRKFVVLGDMLELGSDEIRLHREIANDIKNNGIEAVICVGERMRVLFDAIDIQLRVAYFDTSSETAEQIKNFIQKGDIVMVKGSNSMKMSRICDTIKSMSK